MRKILALILLLAPAGLFAQTGVILPEGSNTLKSLYIRNYPALGIYSPSAGVMFIGDATGGITCTNGSGCAFASPNGPLLDSTLSTNAVDAANSIWGASNALAFEGATANAFETTITVVDPTADRAFTLPNASGTAFISTLATNAPDVANSIWAASNSLIFEGATANDYETTFTPANPTSADIAITGPSASGTLTTSADFPLEHEYWVDASRSATGDGSQPYPFLTIDEAFDAINADATTHAGLGEYLLTNYVVNVAAGTYSAALTLNNAKHVRVVGTGVTISGTIALTQTQQSGDYYSRVEFVGMEGFRAEKGQAMTISGAITATRNNDSLTYVTFKGVYLTGAFTADGDGTWVVYFDHCRVTGTIDTGTLATADSAILLETDWTEFANSITDKVSIYTCANSSFNNLTLTPWYSSTFANCSFGGTISIIPQTGAAESTVKVDPVSYKSLIARSPTLTGVTLVETGTFDTAVANSNATPLVADAAVQYGSTVMPDASADGRFDATTGSGTLSIGVLQGIGPSVQGTTYNIVHGGLARLLPTEDSAITRGHYLLQSATAGRVDDSATVSTDGLNIALSLYSEAVTATIDPAGCTGGSGCINTALDTPNSGPAGQITLGVDVAALGWTAGQPVVYYNSGGTTPTGLTDGNVYWLLSVSTTNVTIAATKGGAVVVPSTQGDDATQYLLRLPLAMVSIR